MTCRLRHCAECGAITDNHSLICDACAPLYADARLPQRIRLSRAKGWRLPEGAVNCARPGPLGNPFVVGQHGTREECVSLYALMVGGYLCLSNGPSLEVQKTAAALLMSRLDALRGRDLACWCALDGKPCHADVILVLANEPRRKGMLDRFIVEAAK